MRTTNIAFLVGGIVLLMIAFVAFFGSGLYWQSSVKSQREQVLTLLAVGLIVSTFAIFFISTVFYRLGTGKPRFLRHAEVNHIYEVKGTVSVGEEKIITVLKEQSGKIRLFEFKGTTKAKFLKVAKLKSGKKFFQLFPLPEKPASPDETAFGLEVPEKS